MDLEELKRIRKENFTAHKKKKREYYLKKKLEKQASSDHNKITYDYEEELSGDNFDLKIKEIIRQQKQHVDSRKEKIIKKINDYKKNKQNYYQENRDKRLEYDKEYRDKKKEELKAYRKKYYEENKEKILAKQKEKRKSKKE